MLRISISHVACFVILYLTKPQLGGKVRHRSRVRRVENTVITLDLGRHSDSSLWTYDYFGTGMAYQPTITTALLLWHLCFVFNYVSGVLEQLLSHYTDWRVSCSCKEKVYHYRIGVIYDPLRRISPIKLNRTLYLQGCFAPWITIVLNVLLLYCTITLT